MTQAQLLALLEKTLKYVGIVYDQSLYSTSLNQFDNNYILEFKHSELPTDGLLFFTPAISSLSKDSAPCKLTIRIPYIANGESTYRYRDEVFDIIVECANGTTRDADLGDIIAYRMCIFRFRKGTNKIILCNSPLYNDASFNNLTIGNCKFLNVPEIYNEDGLAKITLVTSTELNELISRVKALEERTLTGTQDPEDALADKPAGTIYIQVEDD